MELNTNEMNALMTMTLATADVEIDCDECLAQVAHFAESELSGKTPAEAKTLVKQHLEICADCREEYEALLAALS